MGLPNAGKTTLFNALTAATAQTAEYPFTTIEPNVGFAEIPDPRLARLAEIYRPEKITPAALRLVDVAGLVKGASQGEGMGNEFLSHVRACDAVFLVVRGFGAEPDPVSEAQTCWTELLLSDLQISERRLQALRGPARTGDEKARKALALLEKARAEWNEGRTPSGEVPQKEVYLTLKPMAVVLNLSEKGDGTERGPEGEGEKEERKKMKWRAEDLRKCLPGRSVFSIHAKFEEELIRLPSSERADFRRELGLLEDERAGLLREGLKLLDLVTFYTVVGTETRAHLIRRGATAVEAAGQIHTDMAKGFIRAEVFSFAELDGAGSEKTLAASGKIRSEGKDYRVQDGDILRIRFQPPK